MSKPTYAADYERFLNELREVRQCAGMTQEVLASRLQAHQTYVSKCEGGVRRLDVIELRAWLSALGTDLATFATRLEPIPRRRIGTGLAKRAR